MTAVHIQHIQHVDDEGVTLRLVLYIPLCHGS